MVVAIYSHPEYYPPTLNALDNLASHYSEIYVVHRNIKGFDWVYPENVKLVSKGKALEVRAAEQAGFISKLGWFLNYTWIFFSAVWQYRPHTVLLYDNLPILSLRLFKWLVPSPEVLWYHNHDVPDKAYIRKFSLFWMAWKSETWLFKRLNVFSLPAMERKIYFPMNKLKGDFCFLPNYPSLKRMSGVSERVHTPDKRMSILYQGSMNRYHGLEEIIPLLRNEYNGYSLNLILKGFASREYLTELSKLAAELKVSDKIVYLPPTTYMEVLENARKCHIGVGIHKGSDIMNSTLGTASNKIYEYMASGLAVLMFQNEHFLKIFSGRKWAVFTDGSTSSLNSCIDFIVRNWKVINEAAIYDFNSELNFENFIQPVIQKISTPL